MINGALHNCDAGRKSDKPDAVEAIRHVYVHIPFCARICPYCAFYKERADPAQTQRFCEALLRELEMQAERLPLHVETIFFGGGTPTALTSRQLDFLLGGFRAQLPLTFVREWTLEANPGSVSPRKAAVLRRHGVNRISLGVQSWDNDLLRLLGREHDAKQAEASFQILRAAGFTNLNVDLMFGLPGQRLEQWRETLAKTVALGPEHISAYCLTYEEDTEFFLRHARGEYCDDPEREAEFFEAAMELLGDAGYEHYEISNYARPRFASIHNHGYWSGHEYLGIGPSAFSTVGSQRWQNVCDYRAYADRLLAGGAAVATTELLSAEMKRAERIALSLRTPEGVPAEWLTSWPNECAEFCELGLLRPNNGRFTLTTKGKLLADSVAAAFV